MDILESQGMNLSKPILFSNKVEVGDGFHFYYNNDADKEKLELAEIFDIVDSTISESQHNFIAKKVGGTVRKTYRKTQG